MQLSEPASCYSSPSKFHDYMFLHEKIFIMIKDLFLKQKQGSCRQVCVKFKDFSRTSKDSPTIFKDLKLCEKY